MKLPKAIIVGNSGNVLKEEKGEFIDSFDVIIRCNNYKIKSYEKFVGSRTDILCIHRKAWNYELSDDIKEVWLWGERDFHSWGERDARGDLIPIFKPKETCPIIRLVEEDLFSCIPKIDRQLIYIPSTGMYAISNGVKKYKKAYTYGIDGFKSDRHHYWDSDVTTNKYHKVSREREIIKLMNEDNFIESI